MRRILTSVGSLLLLLAVPLVIAAPASAVSTNAKASTHVSQGTAGTSGSPSERQPLSTADQNSGGANGKCPGGPYCSTRDGSPSLNGNGVGNAIGKPCAGCVGKADNKNPPGQYPNGSDPNAGYECDRNHGIGRTNPAHTGCVSALTPTPVGVTPPSSTPPSSTPPSGAHPPTAPPSATVSPSGAAGGSPSGAVSGAETTGPSGTAQGSPGPGPAGGETEFTAAHQTVVRATPSALTQLPFTGIDVRTVALLGLVLVAAGALLRRTLSHS
jgi:hypothetical protein